MSRSCWKSLSECPTRVEQHSHALFWLTKTSWFGLYPPGTSSRNTLACLLSCVHNRGLLFLSSSCLTHSALAFSPCWMLFPWPFLFSIILTTPPKLAFQSLFILSTCSNCLHSTYHYLTFLGICSLFVTHVARCCICLIYLGSHL